MGRVADLRERQQAWPVLPAGPARRWSAVSWRMSRGVTDGRGQEFQVPVAQAGEGIAKADGRAFGEGEDAPFAAQGDLPVVGVQVGCVGPQRGDDRAGHRSSCGLGGALLVQEALEGGALGGVVGGAVLPAAPDDVDPGAGEDAHGVRVVLTAVPGQVVDGRGPAQGLACRESAAKSQTASRS